MVPEALLYDERVTPFAVRLYGALDRYLGPREVAWPGYELLRSRLSYIEPSTGRRRAPSDEALGAAVAVLEAAGWLVVERSNGRSNRYRLLDRPRPQPVDNPGDDQPSTTRASADGPKAQPPAPARPHHPRQRGTNERGERTTPLPPASGGTDEHQGQHPSCRACGTNRRGPAPPDPASQAQAAARRKMEEAAERAAALAAEPPLDANAGRRLAAETRARLRGDQ
jgi:hypothetical protein